MKASHAVRLPHGWRVDGNGVHSVTTMPRLMHIGHRSMRMRRLAISVTLSEQHTHFRGEHTMRCVFNTEMKIDIDSTDDPLRKAFIDLVLAKAREAYGVASMLAKNAPIVTISVIDRDGREVLPLFDAPARDEDDDGE